MPVFGHEKLIWVERFALGPPVLELRERSFHVVRPDRNAKERARARSCANRPRASRRVSRADSTWAKVLMLGTLMTLGIGLYAPCMRLVRLLSMNPRVAFPIMIWSLRVSDGGRVDEIHQEAALTTRLATIDGHRVGS